MAFGKDTCLFERNGGTNAAALADHAETAFRCAIVVRTAIKNHAATALRATLFRKHRELFSDFSPKTQVRVSLRDQRLHFFEPFEPSRFED